MTDIGDAGRPPAQLRRRDLLQAIGLGCGALATGASLAAAQDATPVGDSPPTSANGIRKPGSPTVAGKVFELEGDIDAIFAFVRDEVRYEAYSGALRGPLGTLWGLAGNSVDQAQLLAAMLDEAMVTTRFVTGAIDDSVAAALLDLTTIDLDSAAEHAARVHAVPNLRTDSPELTDEQQHTIADLTSRADVLMADARTQLAVGIETIMSALAGAGIALPEIGFDLPQRERTQHTWLQYAAGPDWIDLDPSFSDAEPGSVYASASEPLDALPDDHFHTVTFRLTAEKLTAGQLQPVELLAHTARSQDLVDSPVTLVHLKPESIKGLGVAIENTVEGTVQYMPHLALGSTDVVEPVERITFGAGGGLFDAFGSGGTPEGDTTAEWLEVTIGSPDQPDRVVTREVFDRLPPEARASGEFNVTRLPPVELDDLGDGGGPTFLPFVSAWSILTATGTVPMSYFDQDYSIDDLYGNLSLLPFGFHLARAGYAHALADEGSPRVFPNRPNLTAFVLSARELTSESITIQPTIDLLSQSVAAHDWQSPFDGSAEARVAAGVLNHVTERALLSGGLADPDGEAAMDVSVARVFEEAARQAIDLAVLMPDAPVPDTVTISPRARLLIEQALSEGFLVLVPEKPVDLDGVPLTGWWQVHLETAETLDKMENGRSTTVGKAVIIRIGTIGSAALRRMTECGVLLAFIYGGIALGLSGTAVAVAAAAGGELTIAIVMLSAGGVGAGTAFGGGLIAGALGC